MLPTYRVTAKLANKHHMWGAALLTTNLRHKAREHEVRDRCGEHVQSKKLLFRSHILL